MVAIYNSQFASCKILVLLERHTRRSSHHVACQLRGEEEGKQCEQCSHDSSFEWMIRRTKDGAETEGDVRYFMKIDNNIGTGSDSFHGVVQQTIEDRRRSHGAPKVIPLARLQGCREKCMKGRSALIFGQIQGSSIVFELHDLDGRG